MNKEKIFTIIEGMENIRFIVLKDNSTNIDQQPAATIKGGKQFESRLKEVFENHYDFDVTDMEITESHAIPQSFNCKVTMDEYGCEEFILLRSWEY